MLRAQAVLVIGEVGEARASLARLLEGAGYQVAVAQPPTDGADSVEVGRRVGLVLIGPGLPCEAVEAAARQVATQVAARHHAGSGGGAAVVALCGAEALASGPSWRERLEALGVDDLLAWPQPPEALLAYVRAVMASQRRVRRAQAGEAKLRAVLQSEPECVKVVSLDGHILDMNPAGLRMIEADEALCQSQAWRGLPMIERVHPADRAAFMALHAQVCAGGSGELVFRGVTLKGATRWMETHAVPLRDDEGEVEAALAVTRDITERKAAEALLREQATLLDCAQDAILVRDLNHRVTYWNRGAERLYGWSAQEVLGQSVRDLLYDNPHRFDAATAAVLSQGEWSGEIEHLTRRGERRVVEGRWAQVRGDGGEVKGVLAINTDITQRKALEAQILRAQRLESIGTLAGGIAHDLNNALAPVMLAAQALRERLEAHTGQRPDQTADAAAGINAAEALAEVALIEQSARRGAQMVRQVLSFARGGSGARLRVQVGEVAAEMLRIIRDTFPKDIQCRLTVAPDVSPVEADPTQLFQLLTNLCVNARDAMPRGGTLTLCVEQAQLDEVYAGMTLGAKPGDYVLLRVEDSGVGIAAEVLDRIFDPFFTTKGVGEGTGLGLSTAHAIVKGYGGFINVYSEVGKGTRFRVYLPACAPAAASADPDAPGPNGAGALPRGNGEWVLVVDDEESIRNVSRRTLERYGYHVLTAANGAEAVSVYVAHRDKVAVVITDMAMPIMDGPATIMALRSLDPHLRIIGSSGLGANGNAARAAGAGVKHFVPKPYTVEVLLKTLRAALTDLPL